MRIDLSGRTAVVTGGANGIGLACARALKSCGADVWIFDLEREEPAAVARRIGVRGHSIDVADRASVEAAFEASGPPQVVVANAGMAVFRRLLDTHPADWEQTLRVNLSGVFHTVQVAARQMRDRRLGSIVITASTNSFDGEPMHAAYNASKSGLLGLIRTAAAELGPHGIRVNAVCPGLIRTRLTHEAFDNPEFLKEYFRHMPLGRGGEPAEVASAAVFLASDLASYITGTTLLVDGGQMASKFGVWNEDWADFHRDHWVSRV